MRDSAQVGAVSREGVSITLTAGQIAKVLDATGGEDGVSASLGVLDPVSLVASSSLLEDRKMSKSLLVGLAVLVSFPADGTQRGVKNIAQEFGLSPSTTHRYIQTLVAVGLLERDPISRRYRRAQCHD
jgi:hypothetical protein